MLLETPLIGLIDVTVALLRGLRKGTGLLGLLAILPDLSSHHCLDHRLC